VIKCLFDGNNAIIDHSSLRLRKKARQGADATLSPAPHRLGPRLPHFLDWMTVKRVAVNLLGTGSATEAEVLL
jgi:hypothetical protein